MWRILGRRPIVYTCEGGEHKWTVNLALAVATGNAPQDEAILLPEGGGNGGRRFLESSRCNLTGLLAVVLLFVGAVWVPSRACKRRRPKP